MQSAPNSTPVPVIPFSLQPNKLSPSTCMWPVPRDEEYCSRIFLDCLLKMQFPGHFQSEFSKWVCQEMIPLVQVSWLPRADRWPATKALSAITKCIFLMPTCHIPPTPSPIIYYARLTQLLKQYKHHWEIIKQSHFRSRLRKCSNWKQSMVCRWWLNLLGNGSQ